jgi:hypothetical protein
VASATAPVTLVDTGRFEQIKNIFAAIGLFAVIFLGLRVMASFQAD